MKGKTVSSMALAWAKQKCLQNSEVTLSDDAELLSPMCLCPPWMGQLRKYHVSVQRVHVHRVVDVVVAEHDRLQFFSGACPL